MGKRIEDYKHINSGRLNNPDVGLVNSTYDSDNSKKGTYLNTPWFLIYSRGIFKGENFAEHIWQYWEKADWCTKRNS